MKRARVYTASVDCLRDMSLYNRTLDVIPPSRRECADRMKVWRGKYLSAGAGLLMCASLADYLQGHGRPVSLKDVAHFHDLRIEPEKYGKPYLPDMPEVHFNLSHSGSYAMCIVSPTPAGCDIEKIETRSIDGVIRCLSPSEQTAARESEENFFRIWTLKESILKLSGKGLGIALNSFEVSLDPLCVRQDFLTRPVRLKEYDALRMTERYCCSCAVEDAQPPEEMTVMNLEDILTH